MTTAHTPHLRHNSIELYIILMLHVCFWTMLMAISLPNMTRDMADVASWAKEWQWGYAYHPPLSSWIAELFLAASHNSLIVFHLMTPLSVAFMLLGVYQLSKVFFDDPIKPLVATVILEGCYFFTFTLITFNPDTLLTALSPWIILMAWRAFHSQQLRHWLILGFLAGCAMLTKYNAILLLTPIILFTLCVKEYRHIWKEKNIYIAATVFLAILTPHIVWLIHHDFITITYLQENTTALDHKTFWTRFIFPLKFLLSQIAPIAGSLLIFFGICYSLRSTWQHPLKNKTPEIRFLIFCFLGPIILTLLYSFLFNSYIRYRYGVSNWSMLGIFLVAGLTTITPTFKKRLYITLVIVTLCFGCAFYSTYLFGYKRSYFNGPFIAKTAQEAWQDHYPQRPLTLAISNTNWLSGNLAFYAHPRLSTSSGLDVAQTPWTPLARIEKEGGIILWDYKTYGDHVPPTLIIPHTQITLMPVMNMPWRKRPFIKKTPPPAQIGWALIAPQ